MKIQKLTLVLAFLLIASPALAGPYVTGKLGVNFPVTSPPNQTNEVEVYNVQEDDDEDRDETITTDHTPGFAVGGSFGYAFRENARIQPRVEFEVLRVLRKSKMHSEIAEIPGESPFFEEYRSRILTNTTVDSSQTYYFVNGFVDYWVKEKVVNLYIGGGADLGAEVYHASVGVYYKPVIESPFGIDLQVRYLFDDYKESPLFNVGVRYEF